MSTATVHVVARGIYWRDSFGREYLRAMAITGRSFELLDTDGRLDTDAQAELERIVRDTGADGVATPAVICRDGGGSRWRRTYRDVRPESGSEWWNLELANTELGELITDGSCRAPLTRVARVVSAGIAATSRDFRDPIHPRLKVSMRGRHGAARGHGVSASAPAVSVPSSGAASSAKLAAITRPNGELYYPRMMPDGMTDVELVRLMNEARVSCLLYGPPGTGKTALLEAALGRFRLVPCTSDTEAGDFLGTPIPEPGGSYVWADGSLLICAKEGIPLIVDEVALTDPRAMAVVYEAMDGRSEVTVTSWPARGSQPIAEGFCVHGACNPDAPGADMSEALLSRFRFQMEYGTDYVLAERLGAPKRLVTSARNLERQRQEGEVTWAPQMRELLGFVKIAKLTSPSLALRVLAASAPVMDRPVVCDELSRRFGEMVEPLRAGDGMVV